MGDAEKREKIIKGLECCKQSINYEDAECSKCPYKNMADCVALLCTDAVELLKEYDDALKLMVYQYCTMKPLTVHDEVFHNKFMSAGEAAFRLLGLKNGQSTDGVWERWFPNG